MRALQLAPKGLACRTDNLTWSRSHGREGESRVARSLRNRRVVEAVGRSAREVSNDSRWHTASDLGERAAALLVLAVVALVAGLTLGHSAGRLQELPGLLLMVPAAIALRGNIFGALGSRLGTSIHAGTFRLSLRPSSVVGENLFASLVLTGITSVMLGLAAKVSAVAFGVADSMTTVEFVTISIVGGVISSIAVMVTALALTSGSVRFGWDPDNVTAPLVTAMGDVATVPALVWAAALVEYERVVFVTACLSLVAVAGSVFWTERRARAGLRLIVRESIPVLLVGVLLDLIAGITVERQIDRFSRYPALLVLLPAFLALAGAVGGTLSSRLSSQLHLGIIDASRIPDTRARSDLLSSFSLAVPISFFAGVGAHLLAELSGLGSPGLWWLGAAAILGGVLANIGTIVVAYYATTASARVGLDPDTYGIPIVTSAMDLAAAFALILAVETLGFA